MQDSNWDDLRFLLAVGRSGSLAGAGRRLGVDETTVGRRLKRAERAHATALFHRDGGRLSPTETGRIVLDQAEAMERLYAAGLESARTAHRHAVGHVRLTAVPIVTNQLLAPAAAALLQRHPGLSLDLIAEPRSLNLGHRDADMALRLARPERELQAIANRIGVLDYGVFAARQAAGETLAWIGYDDTMSDLPQSRWLAEQLARSGEAPPRLRVHDAETLLQMLRSGAGKGLLPRRLAKTDPDLIELPVENPVPQREVWLMQHPDLRPLARMQAVAGWLRDLFARS